MSTHAAQPRRVGYVMTHYPKLAQTFIKAEIDGLQRRGIDVFPMAMNRGDEIDIADPADRAEMERTLYLKDGRGKPVGAALSRAVRAGLGPFMSEMTKSAKFGGVQLRTKLWRSFHFAEALVVWDHCARNDVRHLHAQFAGPSATIALLATQLGTALTPDDPWTMSLSVHGHHDFMNEDEIDLRTKLRGSRFLVVISDYLRSQSLRVTDFADASKIHVVRVGIEPSAFPPRRSEPRNDVPRVCIVGRLDVEKGHVVLLEAVSLLKDRGLDVRLDIVGGGALADVLPQMADDLAIGENVVFHGQLQPAEVARCLNDADVFCLPSFHEGIPVSIMEAMAIGVPVVSSAVMGIPELVVDGETGFAVTASRSDLLADAIERCLTDADLRAGMVAAARQRVHDLHDREKNLDALVALFDRYVFS